MVPLKVTQELKEELLKQFTAKLEALKDGESVIKIEQKLSMKPDKRATVIFTERAFIKTFSLLNDYDTEIAWHGTVERLDDTTFRIDDILVYPQVVSGAHVDTDDKEYGNWLSDLPDEVFDKVRFQAHSHVRMSVSPSSTDLDSQDAIVKQLENDDYYIFAIFNKDLKLNIWIYDMKNNAKYDTEDIDCFLFDPELYAELDEMQKECKQIVVDKAKTWKAADPTKKEAKKDDKKPEKPQQPKAKKKSDKDRKADDNQPRMLYPYEPDDKDDKSWSGYADCYYDYGHKTTSPYGYSYYNYDY